MNSPSSDRITPVILCGGAGTRLWPLSRQARPKQMLALTGAKTMLQMTAARCADANVFAPPVLVAAAAQASAIEAQLGALAIGALILEPSPRNTAPAIALAALRPDADALLLVLPSDQVIADAAGFRAAVTAGAAAAREGWIVTFGMAPDRPETGFGYVKRGPAIGDGVFAVDRFVEKPDRATAERYLEAGGYDWNGGIFLFRAGTMIDALEAHAPDVLAAACAAMMSETIAGRRVLPDADAFAAAPAISIDYAVMEQAERVAVVPTSVGWSDVGSWDALYDLAPRDADANAAAGDTLLIGSSGCLVRSEGPTVTLVGVHDLVVVATGDAVLILPRGESQRVKEAVDALKAARPELL